MPSCYYLNGTLKTFAKSILIRFVIRISPVLAHLLSKVKKSIYENLNAQSYLSMMSVIREHCDNKYGSSYYDVHYIDGFLLYYYCYNVSYIMMISICAHMPMLYYLTT